MRRPSKRGLKTSHDGMQSLIKRQKLLRQNDFKNGYKRHLLAKRKKSLTEVVGYLNRSNFQKNSLDSTVLFSFFF